MDAFGELTLVRSIYSSKILLLLRNLNDDKRQSVIIITLSTIQ